MSFPLRYFVRRSSRISFLISHFSKTRRLLSTMVTHIYCLFRMTRDAAPRMTLHRDLQCISSLVKISSKFKTGL
ncbi:hypothetical protein NXS19_008701 [Fusarium pseudograminearum]|nr:hypothetical protein NXS19_008701 [Fusarium pseudograminearum]